MSGIPQGAMHKGFRAIIYYCREDPRVYIYKHPRWKWVGVTLNFAHPVAFVIVLLSVVSCLCFVLPGVLMQNVVWIFSGLVVWSLLLCRYYFRHAEADFQCYADIDSGAESE